MKFDFDAHVLRTFDVLNPKTLGVLEMRVVTLDGGILIGYFDDPNAFHRTAKKWDGRGHVMVGANPRPHRFFDRAPNRVTRQCKGIAGSDRDIETFTAVCIDLDPVKPSTDVAGTDEECEAVIACGKEITLGLRDRGFAVLPASSGSGIHLILPLEPVGRTQYPDLPGRIRAFVQSIEQRFNSSDVVVDTKVCAPSHMVRVYGTWNPKGDDSPERPWRRSRWLTQGDRGDGEPFLDHLFCLELPDRAAENPELADLGELVIGEEVSERVRKLLKENRKLLDYSAGRGKTRGDVSSSGYDFSYGRELIKLGITDPSELATAIYHRIGGNADNKRPQYLERTVGKLLAETKPEGIDFEIEYVRFQNSDPPIIDMGIQGQNLRLTMSELITRRRFKPRISAALLRVPYLPKDGKAWDAQVTQWLENAEVIEAEEEASADGLLRLAIIDLIDNAPAGETVGDLRRGRKIEVDGRHAVHYSWLAKELKTEGHTVSSHHLAAVLRDLGVTKRRCRIDDEQLKVWLLPHGGLSPPESAIGAEGGSNHGS